MMRTSRRCDGEAAFTLIELLVVMVILGILTAIAVPVFLGQRQRAHDSSTQADLNQLAKEIATYFVDGRGTVALNFIALPGKVVLTDGSGWSTAVNLTNGTASPSAGASANMSDPYNWCVSLTDSAGAVRDFKYSPASGMERGTC